GGLHGSRRIRAPPRCVTEPPMSLADPEALPRLEGGAPPLPSGRPLLAPPDSPAVVLTGTVSGHPRFPNGAAVVTSCVLELDLASARARTRSGRYLPGGSAPASR